MVMETWYGIRVAGRRYRQHVFRPGKPRRRGKYDPVRLKRLAEKKRKQAGRKQRKKKK